MKKLLIILASIIMIGTMTVGCSKDDDNPDNKAYNNLGSEEKMLVDHYWYFESHGKYYEQTYYFYKDHTYYHTYNDKSNDNGTWSFSAADFIITIKRNDGNVDRLFVTKLNTDTLGIKYTDGYNAIYKACNYGKAKENIGKLLYCCSDTIFGSFDWSALVAEADSTYYYATFAPFAGNNLSVEKGKWSIDEIDNTYILTATETGFTRELEDNTTVGHYYAPSRYEFWYRHTPEAPFTKEELKAKVEETLHNYNTLVQ